MASRREAERPGFKEEVAEGVAGAAARRTDEKALSPLFDQVPSCGCATTNAAERLAGIKDGMHDALAGKPADLLAQQLGIPGGELVTSITTEMPIKGVDQPLISIREAILIIGLAGAVLTGNHSAVVACGKALVHDWARTEVESAISHALTGSQAETAHREADAHARASRAHQTVLLHEAARRRA